MVLEEAKAQQKASKIDPNNYVLSVVIPCYNEKDTIEAIVDEVIKSPIAKKEIIVVDNCSTDGTREILREKIEQKVALVLYNEKNIGKGGSLIRGFDAATGDIVVVQDADLEYDPVKDYPKLVQPILDGETQVVYGSRFIKENHATGSPLNYVANKVLTSFSNMMTGLNVTDVETCYKTFSKDAIKSIQLVEHNFGFEPEVTGKIAQKGYSIKEVPVEYYPRPTSEGKKVKFRHGFLTLYCIVKYRNKTAVSKLLQQFLSYLIVGGSAALVEWGVFALFNEILCLGWTPATIIAFVLALAVNYILGRVITFKKAAQKCAVKSDLLPVVLVSIVGLLLNLLLMAFFVELIGIGDMISKIICTGLVLIWNFMARRVFIYNKE